MYNESQITITPVANGYVVVIPRLEPDMIKQIMPALRDMQKEMESDPLISELQKKAENDEQPSAEITRDIYTYVFFRFKDVIDFLKEQFPNA
jgi:hypothetical protein